MVHPEITDEFKQLITQASTLADEGSLDRARDLLTTFLAATDLPPVRRFVSNLMLADMAETRQTAEEYRLEAKRCYTELPEERRENKEGMVLHEALATLETRLASRYAHTNTDTEITPG